MTDLRLSLGGKNFHFETGDGLVSKDSIPAEETVLAERAENLETLVLRPNYGLIPTILSSRGLKTRCLSRSCRARNFTERNLVKNGESADNKLGFWPEKDFEQLLYAPAPYEPVDLVNARIARATRLATKDSKIYICGAKSNGIKRYSDFLSENGKTSEETVSGLILVENEPDFEHESPGFENSFHSEVLGEILEFKSCQGLFSGDHLDEGSRKLLENLRLRDEERILDLGCGYGAIGCFLAERTEADIVMSDDDVLAATYAEENLKRNNLNAEVVRSDGLDSVEGKFDLVVSNPPTHAGKRLISKMLRDAADSLLPNGRMVLVHHRNLNLEALLPERLELYQSSLSGDYKIIEIR